MNFQTVAQNNGNLVAMLATVVELGNQKLNINQKPIQSVKLTDDTGEQHTVTINKGKGSLLDGSALGQRLAFNLSTYQGQQGICYSGFWNSRAQVNQGQTTSQASSQATGQPKPDGGIAESEIRLILVGAAIQSGQFEVKSNIDIEYWKNYIITGRAPLPPSKIEPHPDIQEPLPGEERSDAPF
jgi:hypothetical protein